MQTNNKTALSYIVMGVLLLLLFSMLSFGIETNQAWTTVIDDTGRHLFQSHITNGLTNFIIPATEIGNMRIIIGFTIVLVLLLFFRKRYADGLWLGGTVLFGAAIATKVLKTLFDRDRPEFHQLITKTSESFPSGHATGTTVFYGLVIVATLLFAHKRWQKYTIISLSLLLIIFVLTSRIYLGVHYPTDVIGGFLFGSAAVCLSVGTYILVQKRLVHSLKRMRIEDKSVQLPVRDQ